MSKARPKEFITLQSINNGSEIFIDCHPQQKWVVSQFEGDRTKVRLCRKNVTMIIPKAQFEKYFVVTE